MNTQLQIGLKILRSFSTKALLPKRKIEKNF
jgi:hypothetical protein